MKPDRNRSGRSFEGLRIKELESCEIIDNELVSRDIFITSPFSEISDGEVWLVGLYEYQQVPISIGEYEIHKFDDWSVYHIQGYAHDIPLSEPEMI